MQGVPPTCAHVCTKKSEALGFNADRFFRPLCSIVVSQVCSSRKRKTTCSSNNCALPSTNRRNRQLANPRPITARRSLAKRIPNARTSNRNHRQQGRNLHSSSPFTCSRTLSSCRSRLPMSPSRSGTWFPCTTCKVCFFFPALSFLFWALRGKGRRVGNTNYTTTAI